MGTLITRVRLEIRDKKGNENVVTDHLYKLLHEEEEDELPLNGNFPDGQLFGEV
jgi:hypothetical protein